MINPSQMTRYGQTKNELEETLIFAICVAGHSAFATSRAVDKFLKSVGWKRHKTRKASSPLAVVKKFDTIWQVLPLTLEEAIRNAGIGCYNLRAKTLRQLIQKNLDLATCPPEALEECDGIGPKTSRFFILHTRKDVEVAALDTHILKYLNAVGIPAPKTTPTGKKYAALEKAFIALAKKSGMTIADFDLMIWNYYTKNSEAILWVYPDKEAA